MHARIVRKLGVERRGHSTSLPDDDRICSFGGEHLDAFADFLNFWCTDENHFDRRFGTLAFEIAQEFSLTDRAVDLPSVRIAADADVEGAESMLARILYLGGEQNRPGAGAERGLEADELLELLEPFVSEQLQEGSRLTSRDDQAIDLVQLLGLLDEHNFRAQLFEPAAVGVEIALQG